MCFRTFFGFALFLHCLAYASARCHKWSARTKWHCLTYIALLRRLLIVTGGPCGPRVVAMGSLPLLWVLRCFAQHSFAGACLGPPFDAAGEMGTPGGCPSTHGSMPKVLKERGVLASYHMLCLSMHAAASGVTSKTVEFCWLPDS